MRGIDDALEAPATGRRDLSGFLGVPTQGDQAGPGTRGKVPGRLAVRQPAGPVGGRRAKLERRLLEPVEQRRPEGVRVAGRQGRFRGRPVPGFGRHGQPAVHVCGTQALDRLHEHKVEAGTHFDRGDHLAAAGTPGGRAAQEERHVAPEARPDLSQFRHRQAEFPKFVRPAGRARRSTRRPARARGPAREPDRRPGAARFGEPWRLSTPGCRTHRQGGVVARQGDVGRVHSG